VTDTYGQVVHKSAGYYDSNIRNLVIKNKGTDKLRISLLKSSTSASLISHLQTPKYAPVPLAAPAATADADPIRLPQNEHVVKDAAGWWYKFPNHCWPANCWTQLTSNGVSHWYRFYEAGYLVPRSYLDSDGNWYLLHHVSHCTHAHMCAGWPRIECEWYYFRENAGCPVGSLVVNGNTPDGYPVDPSCAWIQ